RFSTTIGWPMFADILLNMMRLATLLAPPPAKGIMAVMGREGYCCACAKAPPRVVASAITAPKTNVPFLMTLTSCSLELGGPFGVERFHTLAKVVGLPQPAVAMALQLDRG